MPQPLPIGRKTEDEYTYMEAFCLMLYQCEKCNVVETIYNTRDGVTPFIVSCKKCNGAMKHIAWYNDICSPDFNPSDGMRLFVDLTRWKAEEAVRNKIDKHWTNHQHPMKDYFDSKEQAFESLISSFAEGQPDIVVKGIDNED